MNARVRDTLLSDPSESPLKRLAPFLITAWLLLFWSLFFTSPLPNASNAERTIDRLDIVWILPEIYESLLTPDPDPSTSSKWSNLAERADVLGIALLIVATALAAGRLLLRGLGLFQPLPRAERMALAGGIGFSIVSLWTLGTGLAGELSSGLYYGVFIVVLLTEVTFSVATRRKAPKTMNPVAGPDRAPKWLSIGTPAICLPFLCCMLLGAMLPSTDFDVKEYHLGGPKEYFLAGRIQFLPHDVYTSFPFLTEMLSLTGMVLRQNWERGAYAGQTVLMFFAPLTAIGVYSVTRRTAGSAAGWLAAFIYLTIPWTYRISIIAYTEGALCCYLILTVLAFQIWKAELIGQPARRTGTMLFVLGFLAGSAVSTKYPGMILVAIPFAVALVISILRHSPTNPRALVLTVFIYGLGVLVAFGPWMTKNLAETGNPVYPLMYGVFGGADWSPEMHRKWQNAHPPRLFAGNWEDFAGVFYKNDWQSPFLFGLAPLAFLCRRKRAVAALAGYALMLLAAWYLFTHRLDRFWVPMNSVMAVLAGCGLAGLLGFDSNFSSARVEESRRSSGRVQHQSPASDELRLPARVAGCLVMLTTIYHFGFITTPLCGYNAYLSSYAAAWEQTQTPSVKVVDWLKLPPGSKVLFVGEAALFNAHFPYAYNTVFDQNLLEEWTSVPDGADSWKFKPVNEIRHTLHAEGITHVFINWNEILRYRLTYGYTDFVTPQRLQQLVDLDVLTPVPLPDVVSTRRWEDVDANRQAEIERWAPELKTVTRGHFGMLQFQCFQVNRE